MSDEDSESLDTIPNQDNVDLMAQILKEKTGEPNKFLSYWEDDERDMESISVTNSELEDNPKKQMLYAAEKGQCDTVLNLLEDKPYLLNIKDADGYTPLHRASYGGHLEMVKLLLLKDAQIDATTIDGWQPLHSACRWNNTEVALLLVQNGADINAQTNGGHTPLHLASAEPEHRNTIEMLLMNRYIRPHLKNSVQETAADICRRSSKLYHMFEVTEDCVNLLT